MSQTLNLPIVAVTLMEDRANVRRTARLDLEEGSYRFTVEGVSPVIADKTLHGKAELEGVKVLDLQVRRRSRASDERPDAETQALHDRVRAQSDLLQTRSREVNRLSQALAEHARLAAQWSAEVSRDTGAGMADPKRWEGDWAKLRERLATLSERTSQARRAYDEEQTLWRDLVAQQQARQNPSVDMAAALELTLVVEKAASFDLAVEYCVPNACWRPYHVAEWEGDKLRFRSQACLWQNTGEDWDEAALSFSTERATLGTEHPALRAETLNLTPKQKRTVVTAREESVRTVEERASGVPGIDAGGETLRFTAEQPVTVPSDGRPHRVPLFEFEAPAREQRLLMGELRREVFVQTRLENLSKGPILAGPVDLIKSCGLVGRGYLEYAAVGQTFAVDWGPHPELRCHRQQHTMAEEKTLISGWISKEVKVELHLSNLGPHTQQVEVRERLPVSELKSVKIEQDLAQTTDRLAHDKNGFLNFPVELIPYGRKTLTLAYTVSRKKDVEGL